MSYHFFYKKLEATAKLFFPGLADLTPPNWDHLISPLELRLPKSVLSEAEGAIRALHQLSRREAYARLLEPVSEISSVRTPHESLLMAYDFHTTEDGHCKLVEVNTNASGFLLASLMEMTHSENQVSEPLERLRDSFARELAAWGKGAGARVVITDDDIAQQKMFVEFVMYQDWLRHCGYQAEMCEARDFQVQDGRVLTPSGAAPDLIYNRLTDFYLENPLFRGLRQAFVQGLTCVSPNPREYWLLADKTRLTQLTQPEFLSAAQATPEEIESLSKVLIPTFDKSAFASPEAIWAERRTLFFKPKRSHGGKSVYRSESVSRKVFERLMLEDILVQHYTPAQRMPTDDPRSVLTNWKFDLRCFAYGDKIQLVTARIYQGQVTNFASPLGGFTRVQF